ncbi:MAG TPA: glycosyltransferase [Pirellulales bacterium]
MPSLSIVIPALGPSAVLEQTLLAVLESRPADSEIVVIDAFGYDDPYQLRGEVEIISAPQAGWIDCANLGAAHSRGDVLHLLGAGAAVVEGWTEAARERFEDERVGAVAPLARSLEKPAVIVAAGIDYRSLSGVIRRGAGQKISERWMRPSKVFGALTAAGFFRRDAWLEAGGLSPRLSADGADADLSKRISAAGFQNIYEPASLIDLPTSFRVEADTEFQRARRAEHLFWRLRPEPKSGFLATMHGVGVLGAIVSRIGRGSLAHAFGRIAGFFQSTRDAQHPATTGSSIPAPHAAGAATRRTARVSSSSRAA